MLASLRERYAQLAERILDADRIWIGTHFNPDGDAIGSSLGLAHLLRSLSKTVIVACEDPAPYYLDFLPGQQEIVRHPPADADLALALDTGDAGRLGKLYSPAQWNAQSTALLDHHASNPGFCDIDIIDTKAASTAEMVVELAQALDIHFGPDFGEEAATCLLAGIISDTISFRTSNTTSQSLMKAAGLIESSAALSDINRNLFQRQPIDALKLAAIAFDRVDLKDAIATTFLHHQEIEEAGPEAAASKDLTRILASADEPLVCAILRERADGRIEVSMRSKPPVEVHLAAQSLGGGGHPRAAGALLFGPIPDALTKIRDALGPFVDMHRNPLADSARPASPDNAIQPTSALDADLNMDASDMDSEG